MSRTIMLCGRLPSLIVVLLAAGCSSARIPYDLSAVVTSPTTVHPLTVAVLPLEDARSAREAADPDGRFVYRRIEYRGTDLEHLERPAMWRVTEVVGQHLARTRLFRSVVLVLRPEQAPEADLFLRGRVRRLRGYVEAEAPSRESGRPAAERHVLAEVAIDGLSLVDREGQARLDIDVGWSIFGRRHEREDAPIDPWQLLGEALQIALMQLDDELRTADLTGDFVALPRVELAPAALGEAAALDALARLASSPPAGWLSTETSTASRPDGWRASDGACRLLRLEQRQTRRFDRYLGPYRPSVSIWACPRTVRLELDGRAEFFARFLGTREGERYFVYQVGRTNWPDAAEQIASYLAITAPGGRHEFVLEPF